MEKSVNKRLLAGSTLVIAVAVLLIIIAIPEVITDTSPHALQEKAVPTLRVFAFLHLLAASFLIWMIAVDRRGGRMNMSLLLIVGILLIVFSLMLMDGVYAYQDHPNLQKTTITMLACVIFDFVGGLLAYNEWRTRRRMNA